MSAAFHSRDDAHSTTSQLLFGLLAGNLLAVLVVVAFRPLGGPDGINRDPGLVLTVGVMSLVAVSLLFLATAVQRRSTPWWAVTIALNATQIARLVPAIVVLAADGGAGSWAVLLWTFLLVPLLAGLAAVGVVMTLRDLRRSRRRRLARAA